MTEGLWERLCAMPRPHKVVDFPRRDENGELIKNAQIAMWVLTQGEQEEAAARAEQRARDLLKTGKPGESSLSTADIRQSDVYRNCAADELLYRACRNLAPNLKTPFFPTPGHLRQMCTVDEIGVLCQMYYGVQDELGPIVTIMSDAQREALLKQLEKDGARSPLDLLSRDLLIELVIFSASRRASSSMDTSSSGSPPDGFTSNSSSDSGSSPAASTDGA